MKKKETKQLGQTDMLILSILEERDMYGYELVEALKEKSGGEIELKAGTLYPLFHSLEEKGYVSCYNSEFSLGKQRKYYSLTDTGREYLAERKEQWSQSVDTINRVIFG